jgi:hypothetical protein
VRPLAVLALAGAAALSATAAEAGSAWTRKKGKAQVIAKLEHMRATRGYDPDGRLAPLPAERTETVLGVFAEYGVTDRLTLQFKGDLQRGEDYFVDYEGRGPAEIGLTWQVWRGDAGAVSLYGGYANAGDARNAGYAQPGVGEHDFEARIAAGRSWATGGGRWLPERAFAEVQAARRLRDGLPDEVRLDLTLGGHFGDKWMVLSQAYAGATDGDGSRWVSVETSVVREMGDWAIQAGWRRTVAGHETPQAEGLVVGVWRRF